MVFRPTLLDHTSVRAVTDRHSFLTCRKRTKYGGQARDRRPISDQSTASTSGKSQGSRNQKKKPEAIQAEKQAKSSNIVMFLKTDILITSVSNLKEDYKEFNSRLALLETQVEKKGPESSDDVLTQSYEYSL